MKFNWGHGIAIFLGLFMVTIVVVVIYASQKNTELVSSDYYQKEITYQQTINARKNTLHLKDSVFIEIKEDFVIVKFAESVRIDQAEGEIHCYRPNDSSLDVQFDIKNTLVNRACKIPKSKFKPGRYLLSVHWNNGGVSYLWDREIHL